MRKSYIRLARKLVLASLVLPCLNSANAQRLIYRVDLTHVADHYIDVTIQPLDVRPDTMIFQMPVWSPGIYSEVHYGRFIQDLQVLDSSGNEVAVQHTKPDRWKVTNSSNIGQIRYRVKDSHDDNASPAIGLARIDADGVFANTEAIFGYLDDDKSIPATIVFNVPKGWMIATTLEAATDENLDGDARYHQTVFNVDDYEELADAPLLIQPEFQTTSFMLGGMDYAVVAGGSKDFPIDSFAQAASRMMKAEMSFFGKVPYDDYTLIVDAGGADRGGEPFGLAHEESSVYTLPDADWSAQTSWATRAPAIEHLLASTLFKTWNGKRFHVSQLGPVDFTTPVSAHSLWFSEGVSEYYAELLRVRYGLTSTPEFFGAIDRWERDVESTPASSLDMLSTKMCTYDPARISHNTCCDAMRARGALTALLMDIEIRDKSKGRYSLDNVLLHMNADAASGRTYDDKQFIETVSKYSKTDLMDFYNHYIVGADTLPVEAYLEKMGTGREMPESMNPGGELGLDLALNTAGKAIIEATPRDSIVADIPLKRGDTIDTINGEKVTPKTIAVAKTALAAGEPVKLTVVKNAKPVAVTVKAKKTTLKHVSYSAMRIASLEQIAMRKAMIGKRKARRVKKG